MKKEIACVYRGQLIGNTTEKLENILKGSVHPFTLLV